MENVEFNQRRFTSLRQKKRYNRAASSALGLFKVKDLNDLVVTDEMNAAVKEKLLELMSVDGK